MPSIRLTSQAQCPEKPKWSAKIAQLEGRLNILVSLLQSVARSPDSSAALRKVIDEEGMAGNGQLQQQSLDAELLIPTPMSSSNTVSKCTTTTDTDESAVPTSTADSPPTPSSCSLGIHSLSNTCPPPCEPSAVEADACLDVFRSRMLRYFPFIHISPVLTAQQPRPALPVPCHLSQWLRPLRSRN
jgi:hypothetical protein